MISTVVLRTQIGHNEEEEKNCVLFDLWAVILCRALVLIKKIVCRAHFEKQSDDDVSYSQWMV